MTMTIYALKDPRDGLFHYVGKTNKAGRRLVEHRNEHGRVNPEKAAWLEDLQGAGLQPVMEVLETCEDEAGAARELHWIATGRNQGWPLVNKAHGYATTQAKVDDLLERGIHLDLLPRAAGMFQGADRRHVLRLLSQRAEGALRVSYQAVEIARAYAAQIEEILEQIRAVAREIETEEDHAPKHS